MQSIKCQYHSAICDGKCRQGCGKEHAVNSWFCSEECRTKYWGVPNKKTNFEEKMKRAALVGGYRKLTTEELEGRREDAMKWLKENEPRMASATYAEANRRYMAIEDVLMERNVEETLLKQ